MTSVFHRDFDAEIEAEARAAARARASVYTQEDLQEAIAAAAGAAHAAGRLEGHAEGRAEALAEVEARRAEALAALAPKVDRMLAERLSHRAALEQQMVDFVLSVCERVFPEFIASRSARAAAEEVRRILGMALHSPRLRIRLSAATRDLMAPELEALTRERLAPEQTEITVDPSMAPGNAHVAWDDGFAEYSYAAVCDSILDALAAADELHAAPAEGAAAAIRETDPSRKAK